MRRLILVLGVLAGLAAAPAASAAVPSVFDGAVACTVAGDGVRECGGKVDTFDGVPIDVNVAFPPDPGGSEPVRPLVMVFHGWGGSKLSFAALRRWTERGYAAFSMSDRGFGQSCGSLASRLADPEGCAQGHIRLLDTRYEVRDAQHLSGLLVDDGLVSPTRIGATGGSYGGGMSMALAALRNRTMEPDGDLVPWTSPGGTPMELAAAAPEIPWSDLAYSLAPNGRTLDYVADAPYGPPFGVMKQSFVGGLFALGLASGFYSSTDPDADLPGWFARINAGEPYDGDPTATGIADELTTHHSSYYIPDTIDPAPLLISNGWTDDLFPADEAIRFYNRTRTNHPTAHLALFFLDYGHQRGQGKAADVAQLRSAQEDWFAHFVRGDGAAPPENVTALTQTCPASAPSLGPFTGPTWAQIAPGEVRFSSTPAQTIIPGAGSPEQSQAFDPIAGGGACATTSSADQAGTATYRLDPAPMGGLTLLGSATVIADITSPGPHSQVAARLLDVAPGGEQTLVARALYRARQSQGPGRVVFQLHPNGYRFAEGHVAKLELLPADTPYSRTTNGQAAITIANLELRLPVLEAPGAGGGVVLEPAPKPLPDGYELAADFRTPEGPGAEPIPQPESGPAACEDGVRKRGTRLDDRLTGTRRGDRIRSGRGADRIIGRGGRDCLGGGPGKDRINSRDNSRDAVRCGRGRDVAIADPADRLIGCETRNRA